LNFLFFQPFFLKIVIVFYKRKKGERMEKHYRSFIKSLSWRLTGTLDTILISFLITGKINLAIKKAIDDYENSIRKQTA
jgi:D-alanyl-lipoteichoic acid acyltransferase DltB (MBOAT superfamily)